MLTPVRRSLLVTCAILIVLTSYAVITALTLRSEAYRLLSYHAYPLLAQALISGHTALPIEPHPQLLQLSDPYNPQLNQPYRLQDLPLYHGHYYLFHGLTPAILLFIPYQFVTSQPLSQAVAAFLFCSVGFCLAVGCLQKFIALQNLTVPNWLHALGVLLLGFCSGTLNLVHRPEIYQVAGAAAYACAMAALWFLLQAIQKPRRDGFYFAAGIAAALAVGARPNTLFFALALCGAILWRERADLRRAVISLSFASAPLVAYLALLLAYNWIRFDHPLEFGMRYQLASVDLRHVTFLKAEYIPLNAWCYFFAPPQLSFSSVFPFLHCQLVEVCLRDHSDFHGLEYLCSLFSGTIIFAGLLLLPWAWTSWKPDARFWCATLLAALLGNTAYLLVFNTAAVRYLADIQPLALLLLLATLFTISHRLQPSRRQMPFHLAVALATGWSLLLSLAAHLQPLPTLPLP
ncbi:MAG: hypothetical protein B9S26_15240 [Opitutia bacterium Tous-C4FEB]|nr:MAG: hypothetical protein B9S26_15240 [Opitutae bacterium Tous-C4FEB]